MTKHLPLFNFIGSIVIWAFALCGYSGNTTVLAFVMSIIALDAYLSDMQLQRIKEWAK